MRWYRQNKIQGSVDMQAAKLTYWPVVLWLIVSSVDGSISQCDGNKTETSNVTVSWNCEGGPTKSKGCRDLGAALEFSATACKSGANVTISVNSDQTLKRNTSRNLIRNMSYFRLLGSGGLKTVGCRDHAVLHFEGDGMRVNIQNMSFEHCGNKTAALLFSNKMNVSLDQVTVAYSYGSGLFFEDIVGQVNVSKSCFHNNSLYKGYGGGVTIINTERSGISTTKSFNFSYCHFRSNQHVNNESSYIDGGGMYINISTKFVSVVVHNCTFIDNRAKWGAGLFTGIYEAASHNNIIVSLSHFESNYYHHKTINTKNVYNAGGGFLGTTTGNSSRNNVTLVDCIFTGNYATWGGGIALYAAPKKNVENIEVNRYFVNNCKFDSNKAAIGSAVNIYCRPVVSAPGFCNAIPYIKGSNIFKDNGVRIKKEGHASATTVDINGFSTHILSNATLKFETNAGTPLCIRTTALVLEEDITMEFVNNTAETGGGLALYDSWVSLAAGGRFRFTNNTAFGEGGAIYAQQSANLYVPHVHNCFFRFVNNSLHPENWDCKFDFSNNKAGAQSNSIYTTSIIPCLWGYPNLTFCWKDWDYSSHQCHSQIKTSVKNFSNTSNTVTLHPGIAKAFITGVDDLGHAVNISITPSLWPKAHSDIRVKYTDDGLIVYAPRDTKNLSVLIQFDGDRNIFKIVTVHVGGCPPGFGFSKEDKTCKCFENMRNVLQCHGRWWNTSLLNGYCMTYSTVKHHKSRTVYGRCVFSQGKTHKDLQYIPLPEDEKNLETKFCGRFNRKGLLCAECIKNHSIDVFSTTYDCKHCTSSAGSWIVFIVVNGLPPLVLFLAMLILHISFTSGSLNGFIFFSHVVTLSQEALVVAGIINMKLKSSERGFFDTLVDIFSIWSLDNYRIYRSLTTSPVCLGEHLRVIDVLALHYLSALYPFLLIVVAYVVIELHARNCRLLVWLWKPLCYPCSRLRQSWRLQTSVVDAFASFIILSYVKLVRISLILLTFTQVSVIENDTTKIVMLVNNYDPSVGYLSKEHVPFIFLGGIFVVLFGILPPLLLIFYQCKSVQRCLNRCKVNRVELKTFVEVFQGCYKDGRNGGPDRRFFAGLYLIFRVVIFLIYNLEIDHIILYYCLVIFCIVIVCLLAWLQPYKVNFYNYLDIFFCALLAAFFGIHILGFAYLETILKIPFGVIITGALIGCIPLLYLVALICVKLAKKFCRHSFSRVRGHMLVLYNKAHDSNREETTVSKQQSVTYSEVDPRQLLDSTLYEEKCTNASEGDGLLSRARESGYSSITH